MTFKDKFGLKYKTLKKGDKYYLVSVCRGQNHDIYYKIEVTGKENVFTYIKNNNLTIEKESEENVK